MKPFFELIHSDKKTGARAGVIHTGHGDIETPVFMPVGTQATVKTIDSEDLKNLNAQIILGNAYHLHLRPGEKLIKKFGGLHKFMNWDRPILTDSGGFQVFSLGTQKEKNGQGGLIKITDNGVEFRSHIDGSKHFFSPESAIELQRDLGADIIMAFDECTPDSATREYTKKAMERTHLWAKRCVDYYKNTKTKKPINNSTNQHLFGIIQGAGYKELREESARYITSLPFDGIAIGGESVGYNMNATSKILNWVAPYLPKDKPRYTMGVGLNPSDLITVVEHGVDMFDCVAPTRLARHGMLLVRDKKNKNRLNIKNAAFVKDSKPIDKNCSCKTCKNYSRAYLHHLFSAEEITGMRLATIHNLHFLLELMRNARRAILEDKFKEFKKEWA
jgi:queuine tRNA-ribosyltransferase